MTVANAAADRRELSESLAPAEFRCPMCAAQVQARTWGGGECLTCGSVSAVRMPSDDELAEFYRRYNEGYDGGGRSGGLNLQRYAQRYLAIVRRHAPCGELLDVGSSNNPFPNVAHRAGFGVTVLDYRRPAGLVPGVEFVQGHVNGGEPPVALTGQFDIVTAWAVVEHLPSPVEAARFLTRLCCKGGILIISTPEIGTALTDHALGRSRWFYPPEHLCLQSPRALTQVYADVGARLLTWGRLELTPLRYAMRYGVGVVEAAMGWPVRRLWPRAWQAARDRARHHFQGITYMVFECTGGSEPMPSRSAHAEVSARQASVTSQV